MKQIIFLFCLASPFITSAQSSFYNRNADEYFELERFDVLRGKVSDGLHTSKGTVSRKEAVEFLKEYTAYLEEEDETKNARDIQEINSILEKNSEWSEDKTVGESDYSLFDIFYQKRAEFFSIDHPDFFIAANPIFNYQQMVEFGNTKQTLFQNRKGIELRATLKDRIGIYTSFTDNQERGPLYHQRRVLTNQAVPNGGTFYKDFKKTKPGYATDFLMARGYVDLEVIEDMVNVSFGHDRFHLGDGYRSLFLDDVGSNHLFFRINTKFWKVNYQNIFLELTPRYARGADRLLPKKYATMHHLSLNLTKWLNVGVFESIIFSRKDHFEFQYMNPVILSRAVEQGLGSPDNALLGFNFKANPNVGAIFYGQLLLDEFKFDELIGGNGWWANKFAYQIGTKIADPFGTNNLLIQAEYNRVRPFTYSYDNGVSDYSHYNQPLAHPYGSNFSEIVLNVNYKPIKKVQFNLETFYNKKGRDSSNSVSYGGDIFKSYASRNGNTGIKMHNGFVSKVLYTNLNASYEIKPNLYFDLGGGYRNEKSEHSYNPTDKSAYIYGGIRWNTARRRYNY